MNRRLNPARLFRGTHTAGLRRPGTGLAARYANEAARRDELDAVRVARPLTQGEQDEHDRLIARLYMREYRRAQSDRWGPRP